MTEQKTDLKAKLAELKAKREGSQPQEITFDDDLVPEVEQSAYERTESDLEVDRILDGLDVLQAYRKWCGKQDKYRPGQRKNIMISCPIPGHKDDDPSADINLDVGEGGVWHCNRCYRGGDKYDIAAFKFGYDVPGYKQGKSFVDLRIQMVEDMGHTVVRSRLTGDTTVIPPLAEVSPPLQGDSPSFSDPSETSKTPGQGDEIGEGSEKDDVSRGETVPEPGEAKIISIPYAGDYEDHVIEYPHLEWPAVCATGGFLDTWMNVTREDDLPEEFYFWLGMMGLGFAIGRDAVLEDNPLVRGNLFVCLYGPTGQGKSRAIGSLNRLLADALPYDHNDPNSTGAYMVPSPGSAEALVDAFARPIEDPTDPKKVIGHGHVRGLVRFDELSTLIGRASRMGNPMKPMLMEFFDGYAPVEHKTRGMGHIRAEGHFCSTVTTTQPRAVRDLLVQTDVDSGFVNRWIFASGEEKRRVSIGRKPLRIEDAVDPLRDVRGWSVGGGGRRLRLTSPAEDRWDQFFHDELLVQQKADESGMLARGDLMIKKTMLLFAADRQSPNVDLEIVEDALIVWEYLRRSYKMISGEVGMGPFEDIRQALQKSIFNYESRHKKAPTMRDIIRSVGHRKFQTDIVVRVINAMITVEELEEIKPTAAGSGRFAMRYHYVE